MKICSFSIRIERKLKIIIICQLQSSQFSTQKKVWESHKFKKTLNGKWFQRNQRII